MSGFGPVITAMATPFDECNQLNMDSLRKLVIHLGRHGSSAILVTGTTGEAPVLSATEKLRVWETAVDFSEPGVSIIAGVGTNNTRTTLHSIKVAEEAGVQGLLIVTPYYNCPSQEGLLEHFRQAAQSTDLPILLYNIPSRTGVNLEYDTLSRLMEEKNIVGIKDAGGDVKRISKLKEIAQPGFSIYTGDDKMFLDTLKAGGDGVVSVASHVVGQQMARIYQNFQEGKLKEAEELDKALAPVYNLLGNTMNPAPIKGLLRQMGIAVGGLRLPLVPMEAEEAALLYHTLSHLLDS
ncbi:MAG: 4-hydroxy-tetrahydrodipicolinate synthase [Turicibacter sp.]|nr:4-hydroxy-tetrahydrodipicolinate synthase [Turicibacter sp.]